MKKKQALTLRETVLFSMLGALLFGSKLLMEFLPNIHPLAMLLAVYTLVYRWKAFIPLYIFILLEGVYAGFNLWWVPYLYIWAVLVLLLLLIPKHLSDGVRVALSVVVCVLHGLCYGTLYAPLQALMFGLDFRGMIAWIAAGLPWDAIHGAGNLCMGLLILPLYRVLSQLDRIYIRK